MLAQLTAAECEQVLHQGVFNRLQVQSESEFRSQAERYFRMTREEQQRQTDAFSSAFNAVIDALPVGGQANYNRERFRQIDESITDDQRTSLSSSNAFWLETQVASKDVLDAWTNCINARARVSMSLQVLGDPQARDFQILLNWVPQDAFQPKNVLVKQVTITGADLAQKPVFVEDNTLESYAGMSQAFRRTGCGSVTVTVHLAGFQPVHITIPPVTPPPAPAPVWADEWQRTDDVGRQYFKDFVFTHHNPNQTHVQTEQLGVPDARIYRVEYHCVSGGCGWSYNPDGGYSVNATIPGGGQSFTWKRWMQVHNTTILHRALYEVKTRKCVANCPGTSPPPAPACPFGPQASLLSPEAAMLVLVQKKVT
jgi:hypothetical protein